MLYLEYIYFKILNLDRNNCVSTCNCPFAGCVVCPLTLIKCYSFVTCFGICMDLIADSRVNARSAQMRNFCFLERTPRKRTEPRHESANPFLFFPLLEKDGLQEAVRCVCGKNICRHAILKAVTWDRANGKMSLRRFIRPYLLFLSSMSV